MTSKIAIISTQVFEVPPKGYGGCERVVYYKCLGFKELGYKVTLFAPKGSKVDGVKVVECCEPGLNNPEQEAFEIYKDKLDDFDIIYDHTWQKWAFYRLEDLRNKIINILHGPEPFNSIPFDFFNCVCPSKFHAELTMGRYGILAKYVYHGFPIDDFKPCYEKEDYFLFASRWSPYKGPHLFIEWCKKYKVKGVMIGDMDFVEDKKYVERCLKKANKYVEVRGNVDEKERNELMAKAKALVSPLLPPYWEIFGMCLVEAQLFATPVLVTDRGAPREVVHHGVSGYVAKDTFELEKIFKKVAENKLTFDPKACRMHAIQFSHIRMCRKYLQVAKEIPW